MDPQTQFCHNQDCPARGKVGEGNITIHSQWVVLTTSVGIMRAFGLLRRAGVASGSQGLPPWQLD
jgi:hypothetical protein